jgi:hypothetical protein
LYKDQDEIDKIDAQIASLDIEIQKWLNKHENEIAEQEKHFDDFEEEQENKLAGNKIEIELSNFNLSLNYLISSS